MGGKATRAAFGDTLAELPCGRCMDCRVDLARSWSARCTHEASLHRRPDGSSRGAFITLTFSEEGTERRARETGTNPHSLDIRDWQLFAKRLRSQMARDEKRIRIPKEQRTKLRFFAVGEYGDQNLRPHYHALLFNWDFGQDRFEYSRDDGSQAWLSPTLARLWPYGFHDITLITPQTIAYVCRYTTKKLWGPKEEQWLQRTDVRTGEVVKVAREFATMSRRPGIGERWLRQYKGDVFPDDFVLLNGKKAKTPKYYLTKLAELDPTMHENIKQQREERQKKNDDKNTPERRKSREKITKSKLKLRKQGRLG